MKTYSPSNERIKRRYFVFLKEAKRHSESTVDAVAKALSRFETYTAYRDFKTFHFQQAVAFKKHLAEQRSQASREMLNKATLSRGILKGHFAWTGKYQNPCGGFNPQTLVSDMRAFIL